MPATNLPGHLSQHWDVWCKRAIFSFPQKPHLHPLEGCSPAAPEKHSSPFQCSSQGMCRSLALKILSDSSKPTLVEVLWPSAPFSYAFTHICTKKHGMEAGSMREDVPFLRELVRPFREERKTQSCETVPESPLKLQQKIKSSQAGFREHIWDLGTQIILLATQDILAKIMWEGLSAHLHYLILLTYLSFKFRFQFSFL